MGVDRKYSKDPRFGPLPEQGGSPDIPPGAPLPEEPFAGVPPPQYGAFPNPQVPPGIPGEPHPHPHPHPPHHHIHIHPAPPPPGYVPVGQEREYEHQEGRLVRVHRRAFCGCGVGLFLFILGFVFPVAWFVGAFLFCCEPRVNSDGREFGGLLACLVAALVTLLASVSFAGFEGGGYFLATN